MSIVRSTLNIPKRIYRGIKNHPIVTGAVALAADQGSKFPVRQLLEPHLERCIENYTSPQSCIEQIANHHPEITHTIGNNSFGIYPCFNTESMFGISYEFATESKIGFVVFISFLTYAFTQAKSKITKLGLSLFISGWTGNFIDRLITERIYGIDGVTDFMLTWPYPAIWNIADAAVSTGLFLLIYESRNYIKNFYHRVKDRIKSVV